MFDKHLAKRKAQGWGDLEISDAVLHRGWPKWEDYPARMKHVPPRWLVLYPAAPESSVYSVSAVKILKRVSKSVVIPRKFLYAK